MTATEAYEMITQGGATDFARVISLCESSGPYCLIGGLAVNCFVEPVYTLDADLVVLSGNLRGLVDEFRLSGYAIETHAHSINVQSPSSDLRVQFTTDERYQPFPSRSEQRLVFGVPVRVASIEDITQGKIWNWTDPQRRLSKRKKDELDLIRLAESYPELKSLYPRQLLDIFTD
ncbi:MAG: hypothetical protein H7Y20_15855 [Bryobacteraceae bacterium]|nr:hypothetical protein [Bryobacteraceae bacterium]